MANDPHLEEHKKITQEQRTLAWIIGLMLLMTCILVFGFRLNGCSVEPKKETVVQPAPPTPTPPPPTDTGTGTGTGTATACSDGSTPGTAKDFPCPTGQVGSDSKVCSNTGNWLEVKNTCTAPPPPACSKVTFADVQPVLQQYCATCHAAITTYATAQQWSSEIARRVGLPTGNNDHMPQGSAPQPSSDQVTLLQKWVTDGALQDCTQTSNPTFIDLDYQDTAALNDAASQNPADRPFLLYLYMGHAIDAGLDKATLATWVQAANKALNSLNDTSQNLFQLQSVEPAGAVWRLDLRNYAIGAAELAAIQAGDVNININDQTSKGQALAALLGHRPWYHLDNFIDVTFRNSSVYYTVLNIPATLAQLQQQIGVNFQNDLANLNVNFIGSNQSAIAEQKNRLLVRDVEARDQNASYWQTFDVNADPHNIPVVVNGNTVQEDTKKLDLFPLLAGTGAAAASPGATLIYTPDASEVIFTLPNGLHAYALFDGQGNRLNNADPNVVIDTQTPLGNKVINTANSCTRCHNGGFIPLLDQVLATITRTGLPNSNDLQIAKRVYGAAAADPAFFKKDNGFYTAALAKIGVDTSKPDPLNVVTDWFLLNWDLKHTAAFFFKTPDQFTADLNSSAVALTQIGGLLQNQTVTFQQFVGVEQQLITDAREFQDPLGN